MLLLSASAALASPVLAWSDGFGGADDGSFSGTNGWVAGYGADRWSTEASDGVWPTTDESGGKWGGGDAVDNHLVQTAHTWDTLQLDVHISSRDNDAQGLVFRYVDSRNFYLFVITGEGGSTGCSIPGEGGGGDDGEPGARLYVVEDGAATLLSASKATRRDDGTVQAVRVEAVGAELQVAVDLDGDGTLSSKEWILGATDATLSEGQIGLYCFNSGGNPENCRFDDVEVWVEPGDADADGDGLTDDVELLETGTDPDRADTDGDGLSDGLEAHNGTDPLDPLDPGGTAGGRTGSFVGGACDATSGAALGLPSLALILPLRRRRRA